MSKKSDAEIIKKIDETIKYIWVHDIPNEYENEYLFNEDTLKNVVFHYLRKYLDLYFYENDIRIITEYTGSKFQEANCRPDIVIVKMDFHKDTKYFWEDIDKLLCVLELKYKSDFNSSNSIYADYDKLKYYKTKLKVDCKLYMATIWECEDDAISWEPEDSIWAKNTLTELNASYEDGQMRFYVCEHKEMENI